MIPSRSALTPAASVHLNRSRTGFADSILESAFCQRLYSPSWKNPRMNRTTACERDEGRSGSERRSGKGDARGGRGGCDRGGELIDAIDRRGGAVAEATGDGAVGGTER